ncbi:hypothetical protein NPIL_260161 [Nephila pilipes]|uniref:HTH CENPB-type domain-containing protein n=1 Tax=Nephila pilipes TaxID=299642 RepID=A0A8X6NLM7_NEPPI|nr:hypothetical protein NPIL_260161 [Nephila pilipes]
MHNAKRNQIQGGKHEEFEKVLPQWLKETRASNIPVNMELLREKALELSKKLNMNSFLHSMLEKKSLKICRTKLRVIFLLKVEDDWLAVFGGHSSCTCNELVEVDENLIAAQLRDISDIAA